MALAVVEGVQNIGHILRHIALAGKISQNLVICLNFEQIQVPAIWLADQYATLFDHFETVKVAV